MRHPTTNELVERKIEVHKDKTLREATIEAYKVNKAAIATLSDTVLLLSEFGVTEASIGANRALQIGQV